MRQYLIIIKYSTRRLLVTFQTDDSKFILKEKRGKKIKKKKNFLHHERNKTKAIHTLTQTDVIESEQSKTRSSWTKTIIVMIRMQISHREMALTASHVRFYNE
jgi:hypothetical protein